MCFRGLRLRFLTFPLLFRAFWKELCFGTLYYRFCEWFQKPLAHGNCVTLTDFSRLWQFAVFRLCLHGCEGAVVLCSSCRFGHRCFRDMLLLHAAVGRSRAALASRALLLASPPCIFKKLLAANWLLTGSTSCFLFHAWTCGCGLAFLPCPTSSSFSPALSSPYLSSCASFLYGEGSMCQEEAERIKDTLGTLKSVNSD